MDPAFRNQLFVEEKVALFRRRLADLASARSTAANRQRFVDDSSVTQEAPVSTSVDETRIAVSYGPFFFGSQFTFADCVLPPTLVMADIMTRELCGGTVVDYVDYAAEYPALAGWWPEICSHPAVVPVLQAARDATEAWVEKKRGGTKSTCTL
jgi:hypothetical protein